MQKMSYKEKFVQMNKEAKATWIAAIIVIAFWWISGFGVYAACGAEWTILGMPAWFMLSCFGSWILAIIAVVFITSKVFKDFDLDDDEKEGK
jgi:uncharacterized membrane protein YhdT